MFWIKCIDFLSLDCLGRWWSVYNLLSAADSIFFPLRVNWGWVLDTREHRLS